MSPPDSLPRLLVLVGPSGVGKTETAILVAKKLDGEIVSADSRQIYAGFEIGSGAPTAEQSAIVPHHLVASEPPTDRLTAGDYARRARAIILDIWSRKKTPIVVGGSGLYIRALVDGLASMPSSPKIRREITEEIELRGFDALRQELVAIDPEYSVLVGPKNIKRLIRALEVYGLTGKPFSLIHRENQPEAWCKPIILGMERPRPELRELIRLRILAMIEAGWVDEVRSLMGADGLPTAASESVGYRQLARAILDEINLEQAIAETTIATHQFAKRQMTWFRADPRIEWMSCSGADAPSHWVAWILERWRTANLGGNLQ